MQRKRLMALTIVSFGTFVGAASATMNNIGMVDVDYRRDRDIKRFDLDGPVEKLALEADRSDVNCRDISARFADGRMHRIFGGELHKGQTVYVDMPGVSQTVKSLEFSCGARERHGARIAISADIGRYRSDWQRSPKWNSLWAGIFGAGVGAASGPHHEGRDDGYHSRAERWQRVGRETFSGRGDRERVSIGWKGNRVQAIALMPEGVNARCSRVTAEFGNGNHRELDLARNGFLAKDQYTSVDLPGETRNVDGLRLRCRSLQGRDVSIGIYVNK